MVLYKSKDFRIGLKIEIDNFPYIIMENNFVNPGKGQAFNKLKLKNIITNSIVIKTIKIGGKLKSADIFSVDVNFLYEDKSTYFFIDMKLSESYEVLSNIVLDTKYFIKESMLCTLVLWNNDVILVKPQKFVELKVISSDTIRKTSVAAKNFKYVVLETGVSFKVPIFIKENDIVKIDTEKKIYISRIN